MQLPEFLYTENKSIPGIGLVLSTRPPYNIGRPICFDNDDAMDHFIKKYALNNKCAVITGYNIAIVWIGNIDDVSEPVPTGTTVKEQHATELKKMALFYEQERIDNNKTRFKKYIRTHQEG